MRLDSNSLPKVLQPISSKNNSVNVAEIMPVLKKGINSHLQVLEMLESLEKCAPQALNVFIEHASNQGIYKSLRQSNDFRKHNNSVFTKKGNNTLIHGDRYQNRSTIDQYPEIPNRFSKLVTFKASNSQQNSPKTKGGNRKTQNHKVSLFEQITDRSRRSSNGPLKLEKLNQTKDEQLQQNPDNHFDLIEPSPIKASILKKDIIQKGNARYQNNYYADETSKKVVQLTDAHESYYKDNADSPEFKTSTTKRQAFKAGLKTLQSIEFKPITKIKLQQANEMNESFHFDKSPTKKDTYGGATFYNQAEKVSLENLIQKRVQQFSKIPKLAPLIEKNEKFLEFFKRICAPASTAQVINSSPISPVNNQSKGNETSHIKESANHLPSGTGQLKNLRLTKQNLKAHITKRYGKTISERLMIILESCNKSMHNIEYNSYIDLIQYTFFSLQNLTVNGLVFQIPNMYRVMFQILDGGNKGFVCEHDIFQILWSLNQGKQGIGSTTGDIFGESQKLAGSQYTIGISSYAETEGMNLSVNFKDTFPKIMRSVYLEAFSQDYSLITCELGKTIKSQHTFNKQFQENDKQTIKSFALNNKDITSFQQNSTVTNKMEVDQETVSISKKTPQQIKLKVMSPTNRKSGISQFGGQPQEKKKQKSMFKNIVENIDSHNKTAVFVNEDQKASSTQQVSQMLSNQNASTQSNAFSHFNPISQMIKEKKNYCKEVTDIMKEDTCKQMTFEKFLKITKFDNDIPQFLDDLFMHMTTINLKELTKKSNTVLTKEGQNSSDGGRTGNARKIQLTNNMSNYSGENPFLQMNREESHLMRRQIQFVALLKNFDDCDLNRLIKGFTLLSQNSNNEKDILNLFISQQSILDNFKRMFKYQNDSFALRLYNVLSHGVSFNRIYLPTYLMRIYPLFSPNLTEQMYFIFNLFDSDLDGQVNSRDITDFLKNVLTCPQNSQLDAKNCKCQFFQEFDKIYQEYLHTNLLTYRVKKQMINFEFFLREIQYSCLIEELVDKLMLLWDRPSILSHDPREMAKIFVLHQQDREDNYSQVSSINSQGISNVVEKTVKKAQQFERGIAEAYGPVTPGQQFHQHQQSQENMDSSQLSLHQQQMEEDYASLILQSHKAVQEIQRIMSIDPEIIIANPRGSKRVIIPKKNGEEIAEKLV